MVGLGSSNHDPDWAMRIGAFSAVERLALTTGGRIPWAKIAEGFRHGDDLVDLASKALGIFKPRQMSAALSIRTTKPRAGRTSWYRDQTADIDYETGLLPYDLVRHPGHWTNESLRRAFEKRAPLIYFRATETATYEAIWPVWVEHFQTNHGRVLLAAADTADTADINISSVHGYRCAFSGLPLQELLVGAHIRADEHGGPASVSNSICMSTLHHAAFDAHLIGVDPDLRVHVSPNVLDTDDGPLLASLQTLDGALLRVPQDALARPDPEFLDWRFARFEAAQS